MMPIDPVAFSLGPVQVRWYGLMYLAAFFEAWLLGRYRANPKHSDWEPIEVDDLLSYAMLGVVIGGRLGYVLFYDLPLFLENPLEIIAIWHGGMSFHGGFLGVMFAAMLWARKCHRTILEVLDFSVPLVPLGVMFGRIGNFINGELWGAVTTSSWGIAPYEGALPRHPSQLYEAFFEGLILFIIVWWYSSKPRPLGRVAGLFTCGYGIFRFAIEFVRTPDAHIGYLAWGWLTMGQVLSVPLILVGLWFFFRPIPKIKR